MTKGQRNAWIILAGTVIFVIFVVVRAQWIVQASDEQPESDSPAITMLREVAAGGGTERFASRIVGYWMTREGQPCSEGTRIIHEGERLVFASPTDRIEHQVIYDYNLEIFSRVGKPGSPEEKLYTLTPEFFASSDERSFNLVIRNTVETAETATWFPCELTP